MFKLLKWLMSSCTILLLVISLYSCGGSGTPAATGTLDIKLTDAATPLYQAVYVTINEVHVHHETGGWEILTSPELALPQTVNLLELVNGVMLDLGIVELEAGHYNQMRLILEDSEGEPDLPENNILGNPHPHFNYLIDADDNDFPLKVPSGGNTGIKLVNGFDIVADRANELVLDFDAHRSIVQKGNGDFGLKPTIKVLETVDNTVSGTVVEADDGPPIDAALISAQIYTPPADGLDPKDEVIVESTTETEPDGTYTLLLPLNTYNLVATAEGYQTACKVLEAEWYFDNDDADFDLVADTETGIELDISVSGLPTGTEDDTALLSFRQTKDCGQGDVIIEVDSLTVENGDYSRTLPAGTYDLVVSAQDKSTQVFENISGNMLLNISF